MSVVDGIVYAGASNDNTFDYSNIGLYVSTDSSLTNFDRYLEGKNVSSVYVDDNGIIYVGTDDNLYVSTNNNPSTLKQQPGPQSVDTLFVDSTNKLIYTGSAASRSANGLIIYPLDSLLK